MYGMASGASVSDLFLSGIIPGLLIGGLLMLYAIFYCKKNGEDKEKINAVVGELHEKGLLSVLKDSFFALLSPVIILATSVAFSRVLALMQVPQAVSGWILAHFTSKVTLLLAINLFLLLVGMVMDTTPAILILTPILLPLAEAVGMHPVHFGIMMVVNLAIGFVTPPIGVNLFVASSLADIPVMKIAAKAMPMIFYFLLALLLLTFLPGISMAFL